MKFILDVKEEARLEVLDAYIYYEEQSTGLGERFLKQLDVYLEEICKNPEHFQIKRNPYREAYIKKFPFLIIFEILEGKVIIYSIFNANRNPENKPQ